MKNYILTCIICLFLTSCSNHSNGLVGTWKSDAKKSLASLNEIKKVDPKAKELLENDFFGHLVVEYKKNKARSYFDNCIDQYNKKVCEEMKAYSSYELIEETQKYFIISYFDQILNSHVTKKLVRENNCYYLIISEKLPVKEYFCRE